MHDRGRSCSARRRRQSAASSTATVFSLSYDFHFGNGSNGNVYGITNNKDNTSNQTFNYDALNRLTSAQNAGTDCSATPKPLNPNQTKYWGNGYAYDAWGNLLQKIVTKCNAEQLSVTADNNNRLVGYSYDIAGNMTQDPTDGVTATYDAENRIATAIKNGVTTPYTYDDDGNRVAKSNGTTPTLYWYMAPGIVAESDLTGALKSEYVFFDGERVARRDGVNGAGGVFYYFSDHLKTTDIVTDASGKILNESDFYPWGGELQFVASDSNHYKFTGKERDSETQLDYFGARYYGNALGRFLTPDWAGKPTAVPYAHFGNPQSLNLYSYVQNNPTTMGDPDGHCVEDACIVEGGVTIGAVAVAVGMYVAPVATGMALGWAYDKFVAPRIHPTTPKAPPSPPPSTPTTGVGAPGAQTLPANGAPAPGAQTLPASGVPAPGAQTVPAQGGPSAIKEVHGNDHATEKPAIGYSLRDKDTGEVVKYGETTQGAARYTKAQLKAYNADFVPQAIGSKADMYRWQHEKILEYKSEHNGARPRFNKSDY